MKVDGNHFDGRILFGIFDGFVHAFVVERVHYHVDTQVFVPTRGDVLFQPAEGAFAAHGFVVLPDAVQTDPDAVGMAAGKGQLCVGGYGGRVESDAFGQVYQVVDAVVAVAPDGYFAAFEIDKARPHFVGIFEVSAHFVVGHIVLIFLLIDAAVLALQIAAVADEKHCLQRLFAAEESCAHKPPRQIEELFYTHCVRFLLLSMSAFGVFSRRAGADAVGACVLWLARVPIRLFCARCPIAECRALSTR